VRSTDTASASDADPVCLTVQDTIAAGDQPVDEIKAGHAVEIMTGAVVPQGCDAVVPVERVEKAQAAAESEHQVIIRQPVAAGQHIRLPAEDFRRGETVIGSGQLILPHGLMGMAATGVDEASALRPPNLAILTTGDELTAAGIPERTGIIRDANGPYLKACAAYLGVTLTGDARVSDSPESLENSLREFQDKADIILTTGGVSAGRYDAVPDVVVRIGGEILFHKVAIRPGKPLLFARLANGKLLFGLPGNPIAVAACLRFFVVPALRLLQGLPAERFHPARAIEDMSKKSALRFFGKARATVDNNGLLQARLLPGQESFKINSLVKSNAWVIIPETAETIRAGDLIEIAPLYPTGFLQ
jgi:molybdopterin molybdotransferase